MTLSRLGLSLCPCKTLNYGSVGDTGGFRFPNSYSRRVETRRYLYSLSEYCTKNVLRTNEYRIIILAHFGFIQLKLDSA